MTIVSNARVHEEGEKLRSIANQSVIPYVRGGGSLSGMDCQGLVEYALQQAGVPRSECNLGGSNSHWRACVWRGTPEECVALFGCVPVGAAVFIWKEVSSTTPEQFREDGLKDAEHMGLKITGCVLHASSTREKVAESVFNDKTIPNGGWNMVGLLPWVDYGPAISAAIGSAPAEAEAATDAGSGTAEGEVVYDNLAQAQAAMPVQDQIVRYVRIVSTNGGEVRIREQPKKGAVTKYSAAPGTLCPYQGERDGFYKILYLGKSRYVKKEFGQIVKVRKG